MHIEVVLSTTESKYVGCSESLRIAIIMTNLLKERKEHCVDLPLTTAVANCKLFEGNAGAIHQAKAPKIRPCMRHI
jgi:hypothetical protein